LSCFSSTAETLLLKLLEPCHLSPRVARVLAELVAHLFMKTLSDLKDHPLDAMDHRLAAAPLPHPMILNNWESKNER
jgi:hypothetical protein